MYSILSPKLTFKSWILTSEKKDQVGGVRGGVGDSGNARKKTFFFCWYLPSDWLVWNFLSDTETLSETPPWLILLKILSSIRATSPKVSQPLLVLNIIWCYCLSPGKNMLVQLSKLALKMKNSHTLKTVLIVWLVFQRALEGDWGVGGHCSWLADHPSPMVIKALNSCDFSAGANPWWWFVKQSPPCRPWLILYTCNLHDCSNCK